MSFLVAPATLDGVLSWEFTESTDLFLLTLFWWRHKNKVSCRSVLTFHKRKSVFDDVIRNISAFENSKRKFMGAHRLYQSWRRISRPEIFILGSLLSVTTSIGSGVKRGIIGQCTQKNPFLIQQVSNFVLGFFGKSNCLKNTYTTIGCAKKKREKSILHFWE